jgi:citrate lyase subunit beta/citryl-CoA lyase
MIETCPVMFELKAVAASSEQTRLGAFVMGVNDLAKEMRAQQTADRAPFIPFLAQAVAAARAHGLTVLDGVHNEIDDLAALETVCRQGAAMGFDGKTLIHPSHLDITNRVFSPAPEEVAWSRAVVAAFEAPENAGKGALRVEGRLAEHLHRDQARQLIAVAEAIAAAEAT